MKKQKKTQKLLSENRVRNRKRAHLEGLVADLRKNRNDFKNKIHQQTDELKVKNEQLRSGAEKQIRSEEQIHIRTKAMESTADGIFIIDAQKPNFPIIYAK